jgi:hypothetical protein
MPTSLSAGDDDDDGEDDGDDDGGDNGEDDDDGDDKARPEHKQLLISKFVFSVSPSLSYAPNGL